MARKKLEAPVFDYGQNNMSDDAARSLVERDASEMGTFDRSYGTGRTPAQNGQVAFNNAKQEAQNEGLIPGGDTVGNSVLGTFVDSAQAAAYSGLSGTARFAGEFSPFGGETLNKVADWANERAEFNTAQQPLEGAHYIAGAIGNAVGSGAEMMAEAAIVAGIGSAIGATGVGAGALAVIGKSAKLNKLRMTAQRMWQSSFYNKYLMANIAGSPFEAMAEAGNLITEMRKEGYSDEDIRESALKSAAYNTGWLLIANSLEAGIESRVARGLAKNIAKDGVSKFMREGADRSMRNVLGKTAVAGVLDAAGEGMEEMGQEIAGTWAKDGIGSPIDWDNTLEAGIQGAIGGAFLGGARAGVNARFGKQGKHFKTTGPNGDVEFEMSPEEEYLGEKARGYSVNGDEVSASDFFANESMNGIEDGVSEFGNDRHSIAVGKLNEYVERAKANGDTSTAEKIADALDNGTPEERMSLAESLYKEESKTKKEEERAIAKEVNSERKKRIEEAQKGEIPQYFKTYQEAARFLKEYQDNIENGANDPVYLQIDEIRHNGNKEAIMHAADMLHHIQEGDEVAAQRVREGKPQQAPAQGQQAAPVSDAVANADAAQPTAEATAETQPAAGKRGRKAQPVTEEQISKAREAAKTKAGKLWNLNSLKKELGVTEAQAKQIREQLKAEGLVSEKIEKTPQETVEKANSESARLLDEIANSGKDFNTAVHEYNNYISSLNGNNEVSDADAKELKAAFKAAAKEKAKEAKKGNTANGKLPHVDAKSIPKVKGKLGFIDYRYDGSKEVTEENVRGASYKNNETNVFYTVDKSADGTFSVVQRYGGKDIAQLDKISNLEEALDAMERLDNATPKEVLDVAGKPQNANETSSQEKKLTGLKGEFPETLKNGINLVDYLYSDSDEVIGAVYGKEDSNLEYEVEVGDGAISLTSVENDDGEYSNPQTIGENYKTIQEALDAIEKAEGEETLDSSLESKEQDITEVEQKILDKEADYLKAHPDRLIGTPGEGRRLYWYLGQKNDRLGTVHLWGWFESENAFKRYLAKENYRSNEKYTNVMDAKLYYGFEKGGNFGNPFARYALNRKFKDYDGWRVARTPSLPNEGSTMSDRLRETALVEEKPKPFVAYFSPSKALYNVTCEAGYYWKDAPDGTAEGDIGKFKIAPADEEHSQIKPVYVKDFNEISKALKQLEEQEKQKDIEKLPDVTEDEQWLLDEYKSRIDDRKMWLHGAPGEGRRLYWAKTKYTGGAEPSYYLIWGTSKNDVKKEMGSGEHFVELYNIIDASLKRKMNDANIYSPFEYYAAHQTFDDHNGWKVVGERNMGDNLVKNDKFSVEYEAPNGDRYIITADAGNLSKTKTRREKDLGCFVITKKGALTFEKIAFSKKDLMATLDEIAQKNKAGTKEESKEAGVFNKLTGALEKAGLKVIAGNDAVIDFLKKQSDVRSVKAEDDGSVTYVDTKGNEYNIEALAATSRKIILLSDKAKNFDSPVHEYTHMWLEVLAQKNPKLWEKIKDALETHYPNMWENIRSKYEFDKSQKDDIAHEVMAFLAGGDTEKKLREIVAREDIQNAEGAIQELRSYINEIWEQARKFLVETFNLDLNAKDIESIRDMIVKDLIDGNLDVPNQELSNVKAAEEVNEEEVAPEPEAPNAFGDFLNENASDELLALMAKLEQEEAEKQAGKKRDSGNKQVTPTKEEIEEAEVASDAKVEESSEELEAKHKTLSEMGKRLEDLLSDNAAVKELTNNRSVSSKMKWFENEDNFTEAVSYLEADDIKLFEDKGSEKGKKASKYYIKVGDKARKEIPMVLARAINQIKGTPLLDARTTSDSGKQYVSETDMLANAYDDINEFLTDTLNNQSQKLAESYKTILGAKSRVSDNRLYVDVVKAVYEDAAYPDRPETLWDELVAKYSGNEASNTVNGIKAYDAMVSFFEALSNKYSDSIKDLSNYKNGKKQAEELAQMDSVLERDEATKAAGGKVDYYISEDSKEKDARINELRKAADAIKGLGVFVGEDSALEEGFVIYLKNKGRDVFKEAKEAEQNDRHKLWTDAETYESFYERNKASVENSVKKYKEEVPQKQGKPEAKSQSTQTTQAQTAEEQIIKEPSSNAETTTAETQNLSAGDQALLQSLLDDDQITQQMDAVVETLGDSRAKRGDKRQENLRNDFPQRVSVLGNMIPAGQRIFVALRDAVSWKRMMNTFFTQRYRDWFAANQQSVAELYDFVFTFVKNLPSKLAVKVDDAVQAIAMAGKYYKNHNVFDGLRQALKAQKDPLADYMDAADAAIEYYPKDVVESNKEDDEGGDQNVNVGLAGEPADRGSKGGNENAVEVPSGPKIGGGPNAGQGGLVSPINEGNKAPGKAGSNVSGIGSDSGRAGSNQQGGEQEPANPKSGAGDTNGERTGGNREQGKSDDGNRRGSSEGSSSNKNNVQSNGRVQPGDLRLRQQEADNKHAPFKAGDLNNIRETLPILLPGQDTDIQGIEKRLYTNNQRGMLAANGTGTGKTIVGLGFIKRQMQQKTTTSLVVVPTADIGETAWAEDGKLLNFNPYRDASGKVLKNSDFVFLKTADAPVVGKVNIITYASFYQNRELLKQKFDIIICDESHKISGSENANEYNMGLAVEALRANGGHRDEGKYFGRIWSYKNRVAAETAGKNLDEAATLGIPKLLEKYKTFSDLNRNVRRAWAMELTPMQRGNIVDLVADILNSSPEEVKKDLQGSLDKIVRKLPDLIEERFDFTTFKPPKVRLLARLDSMCRKIYFEDATVEDLKEARKMFPQYEGTKKDTKVLFLSATPFSYPNNTYYAEGFLFNYKDYGGDFTAMMQEQFGYIVKEPKLKPGELMDDSKLRFINPALGDSFSGIDPIDNSIREVDFHNQLLSEGAMSKRQLEVDQDYNRQFVVVDGGVGRKIDDMFDYLMNDKQFKRGGGELALVLEAKFTKEGKNSSLFTKIYESIKARAVIPMIKQALDEGKQVVLFHDLQKSYDLGELNFELTAKELETLPKGAREIYESEEFKKYRNINFGELRSALEILREEFGSDILAINGEKEQGAKKEEKRKEAIEIFQGKKPFDSSKKDSTRGKFIAVTTAAGAEGVSLHDINGKAQRILFDIGIPRRATDLTQIEGRIYRTLVKSNAIYRYLTTNSKREQRLYQDRIANKAQSVENLALGDNARLLNMNLKIQYNIAISKGTTKNIDLTSDTGGKAAAHKSIEDLEEEVFNFVSELSDNNEDGLGEPRAKLVKASQYKEAPQSNNQKSEAEKKYDNEVSDYLGDVRFLIGGMRSQNISEGRREAFNRMQEDKSPESKTSYEKNVYNYNVYGWWLGADNKWRFYIKDSYDKFKLPRKKGFEQGLGVSAENSRLLLDRIRGGAALSFKLEELYPHETLYKHYPELKKLNVVFGDNRVYFGDSKTVLSAYDKNENCIRINTESYFDKVIDNPSEENLKQYKLALLHEIQHAIQKIEGFATGASSDLDGARTLLRDIRKGLRNIETSPSLRAALSKASIAKLKEMIRQNEREIAVLMNQSPERARSLAKDIYARTYGELEAMAVMSKAEIELLQNRINEISEKATAYFKENDKATKIAKDLVNEATDKELPQGLAELDNLVAKAKSEEEKSRIRKLMAYAKRAVDYRQEMETKTDDFIEYLLGDYDTSYVRMRDADGYFNLVDDGGVPSGEKAPNGNAFAYTDMSAKDFVNLFALDENNNSTKKLQNPTFKLADRRSGFDNAGDVILLADKGAVDPNNGYVTASKKDFWTKSAQPLNSLDDIREAVEKGHPNDGLISVNRRGVLETDEYRAIIAPMDFVLNPNNKTVLEKLKALKRKLGIPILLYDPKKPGSKKEGIQRALKEIESVELGAVRFKKSDTYESQSDGTVEIKEPQEQTIAGKANPEDLHAQVQEANDRVEKEAEKLELLKDDDPAKRQKQKVRDALLAAIKEGEGRVDVKGYSHNPNEATFSDIWKSPSRLAEKYPLFKVFFNKAVEAQDTQEKLRYKWGKDHQEVLDGLTAKELDDYENIMLAGEFNAETYTAEELKAQGFSSKVINAYRKNRAMMNNIWKNVNDAHRHLTQVAPKTVKVKTLQSIVENKFNEDVMVKVEYESGKSRFVPVVKEGSKLVALVYKGDKVDKKITLKDVGKYEVKYSHPQIYELNETMSKAQLEELRKSPYASVVSVEVSGKPKSIGLNGEFFDVSYRAVAPAIGKIEGYLPHIFEQWMICVETDGEQKYVPVGSAKTVKEATAKAEAMLKENKGLHFVVQPKVFNPAQFIGGVDEAQAGKKGDLIATGDQYRKFVRDLVESNTMSIAEAKKIASENLHRTGIRRFAGFLRHRKGAAGYNTDVIEATNRYITSASRYVALEKFKSESIPLYEKTFKTSFESNLDMNNQKMAWLTRNFISYFNGTPSAAEHWINETLNRWGWWNKHVNASFGERSVLALAGRANALVSTAKLGYLNISSALINTLQLTNTYALVGSDALIEGLKGVKRMSLADRKVLAEVGIPYNIGLDSASGFTSKRLDKTSGKTNASTAFGYLYEQYMRMANKGMFLFKQADVLTRNVATLAAYYQATKGNKFNPDGTRMTHAQAIAYAKEVNRKANFDYGAADTPAFMRLMSGTGVGELMMLFKKYPVKEFELMHEMFFECMGGKASAREKARFWGTYVLFAGLFGAFPAQDWLDGWLKKLLGYSPVAMAKAYLFKQFGDNTLTRMAIYGAGAAVGLDIGRRSGIPDLIPNEDSVLAYMAGATGSTIGQLLGALATADGVKAVKAWSPALGHAFEAAQGYKKNGKGQITYRYEGIERGLKAMGFKPVGESIAADMNSAAYGERTAYNNERQKVLYEMANKQAEGKHFTEAERERMRELNINAKQLSDARKKLTMTAAERTKANMDKRQKKEFEGTPLS